MEEDETISGQSVVESNELCAVSESVQVEQTLPTENSVGR